MTNQPTDVCVLFALEREAAPFLRQHPPQSTIADAPCWAAYCGARPILVLQTGVGHQRMERALAWLFSQPNWPRHIISAGYSGALVDDLQVGEVILASEVINDAGQRYPVSESTSPLRRGRLLCVSRLIGEPAEKRWLGKEHDAVAVDMESAIIARRCADNQVAFTCLRVISDHVDTPLDPRLASLLGGSQVSIGKVLRLLLRSPRLAVDLIRLARDTRRASQSLSNGLADILKA